MWNPCVAVVPMKEESFLYGVLVRPAGKVPLMAQMSFVAGKWGDEDYAKGPPDSHCATPTMSMYVFLHSKPTRLLVGPVSGPIEVNLE